MRRLTETETCSANAARGRNVRVGANDEFLENAVPIDESANGAYRARTGDLVLAKHALSQLS